MKKLLLKKTGKLINDERLTGDKSNIFGNASRISGNANRISGNVSGLSGDVSVLSGDVTYIYVDENGIYWDVSDCEISDEERKKGICISDLVKIKEVTK